MIKKLKDYFSMSCNAEVALLSTIFSSCKAPFEMAYFKLKPNESTDEHHHIDKELFVCINGVAKIQVNKKEIYSLFPEQIIFIDSQQYHKITNDSNNMLTMLSISWAED